MDGLIAIIIFVVFIAGGSCSLAGTWWAKRAKGKEPDPGAPNMQEWAVHALAGTSAIPQCQL